MTIRVGSVEAYEGEAPIVTLARAMLIAREHDGWDQPPELAVISERDDVLTLMTFPFPAGAWSAAPPPFMLRMIANVFVPSTPAEMLIGWCGYAFLCEGWTFPPRIEDHEHSCTSAEDCPYLDYVLNGGRIADHLDGIEGRSVTVAMNDGSLTLVSQHRGEEPRLSGQAGGASEMTGNVPDALREVVEATKRAIARATN